MHHTVRVALVILQITLILCQNDQPAKGEDGLQKYYSTLKNVKVGETGLKVINLTNVANGVTLETSEAFIGDSCPTGMAKVNGKCVDIV